MQYLCNKKQQATEDIDYVKNELTSFITAKQEVFDYIVPEKLNVQIGDRVLVNFGNRKIEGFVINLKNTSDYDKSKLKDIISKLDSQPLLSENMLRLFTTNKRKEQDALIL